MALIVADPIQAIPVRYRGCEMRSRLEGRWAVFLDTLGVPWEYEKEGYRLAGAGWYVPDFWLPELGCWLEVKPSLPTANELRKARSLMLLTGYPVIVTEGSPWDDGLCVFTQDEPDGDEAWSLWACGGCGRLSAISHIAADAEEVGFASPRHIKGCRCIRPGRLDDDALFEAFRIAQIYRFW